jgi:hypothetical protein
MSVWLQLYLAVAVLTSAYTAYADPIPGYRGVAFDIVLYILLGLWWPATWTLVLLCLVAGIGQDER